MIDENERAKSARAHDDQEMIEEMEKAPSQGGTSGGNLQRDVGTEAEAEHQVEGDTGVTRVRGSDKKDMANLPRFNPR